MVMREKIRTFLEEINSKNVETEKSISAQMYIKLWMLDGLVEEFVFTTIYFMQEEYAIMVRTTPTSPDIASAKYNDSPSIKSLVLAAIPPINNPNKAVIPPYSKTINPFHRPNISLSTAACPLNPIPNNT